MKKAVKEMFSDGKNELSFMRLLCFLSFVQSCALCYLGMFHSKDGITLELGSVIFTYISAAFLGKHYSKLVESKNEIKETKEQPIQDVNQEPTQQVLNE